MKRYAGLLLVALLLCLPVLGCEEKLWPKNLTFHAVRIYYSDTTVDVFTEEEWKKAPSDDVQIVVVFFKDTYTSDGVTYPYRFLCHSVDYHWWGGCGNAEDAARFAPHGTVKDTKWMFPNDRWQARYQEAENDKGVPR